MNKIKNTAVKTKDLIVKHRAKIAAAATIVVMAKLNSMVNGDQLAFIESKGLTEEYFNPEI